MGLPPPVFLVSKGKRWSKFEYLGKNKKRAELCHEKICHKKLYCLCSKG
jgi:hypothetical protein